jgi:acyl dehydratase
LAIIKIAADTKGVFMSEYQSDSEVKLTPQEKDLFERWKAKIGKIFVPLTEQEAMADELVIYFFGLGAEATWTWIKRWATVNEDYNALWFDEEYARNSRWGGLTAPPLYLISVNDGLQWPETFTDELCGPYMVVRKDKFPYYSHTFQAESEWEFFEPVRPGDTISAEAKLADIYWKQGGKYRMCFLVGETTMTNQKKQLVGRNKSSVVYLFKNIH